jgi:hypothetical protein
MNSHIQAKTLGVGSSIAIRRLLNELHFAWSSAAAFLATSGGVR